MSRGIRKGDCKRGKTQGGHPLWFPPFDSPKQQYGRSMPKTMKSPPKQNNNTNSKILYQVKATMGNREGTILQFVEKEKRLKKGVDIWFAVWYYNKAVARESEKQEKNRRGSGPEGIQRHKSGELLF